MTHGMSQPEYFSHVVWMWDKGPGIDDYYIGLVLEGGGWGSHAGTIVAHSYPYKTEGCAWRAAVRIRKNLEWTARRTRRAKSQSQEPSFGQAVPA